MDISIQLSLSKKKIEALKLIKREDNKHGSDNIWFICVFQAILDIFIRIKYNNNAMLIASFCDTKPGLVTKVSYFKHSTDVIK